MAGKKIAVKNIRGAVERGRAREAVGLHPLAQTLDAVADEGAKLVSVEREALPQGVTVTVTHDDGATADNAVNTLIELSRFRSRSATCRIWRFDSTAPAATLPARSTTILVRHSNLDLSWPASGSQVGAPRRGGSMRWGELDASLIEALTTGSTSRAIGNCSDLSTRNSRYDGTDRPYSHSSMCASPCSTRHSPARSGDSIRISIQTMKITQYGFQRPNPRL